MEEDEREASGKQVAELLALLALSVEDGTTKLTCGGAADTDEERTVAGFVNAAGLTKR